MALPLIPHEMVAVVVYLRSLAEKENFAATSVTLSFRQKRFSVS
jgi:hypothetical protein